ncbi:MAG TPA: glycosyl hydrolase family 28-related protein [Gammaproteobacteria bacterium]
MSITSTDRKAGPFSGNDSTTSFPFSFKVYAKDHLQVILTSATGVEAELTLDSDYSVSLNADQDDDPGGSITYPISGDPLATGEKLTIVTTQPAIQDTVLVSGGAWFPKTIEKRLDWLTILVQQLEEKVSRAPLGAISDNAPDFDLGLASDRANRFLAFDSSGNVSLASSVVSSSAEIVHFDGVGDGVTDVTSELQAALNNAAGSARLHIPAGTYIVSATVRIPSNTYLYGDGMERTIIKMAGTVGRNTTVMQTGADNDQRTGIVIEDLTIDANEDRWAVAGGTEVGTSSTACALAIVYTERCVVRRVEAKSAHSHGIDVAASQQSAGPTSYEDEPSRYVWIEGCRASNCGDDNITTHFCSDVWITGCYSVDPSGARVPGNSNCFEIDDGSRNVFLTDNLAVGGDCGLQIKGHNTQPAPYNVHVSGFRAVNNRFGVEIRHTGWYSATDEDLEDETVDEEGNPFEFTGASPNARNLILNNIMISRPTNRTPNGTAGEAVYGFRLRSYENVIVNNLIITDGTLDAPDDYDDFDTITNNLIRVYSGARHVLMRNVAIYGFPDIVPSGTAAFWCTSSLAGPLLVDGLTAIDGPSEIFRCSSSAGPIYLDNYFILGDHSASGTNGVIMTGSNKRVGQGVITGYDASAPDATGPLWELRAEGRSTGGGSTTPIDFASLVWVEGTRDLGTGEGINLAFKCNLVDNGAGDPYDGVDYTFGGIQFRKTLAVDSSAVHDFAVQLIAATDESAPRDVLVIDGGTGATRLHRGVEQTNGSITFALTDLFQGKYANGANSQTYTIDTNANVPLPVGAEIHIVRTGSGTTTITAAAGVNLWIAGDAGGGDGVRATIDAVGDTIGRARLIQYTADSWLLAGEGVTLAFVP